MVLLKKKKKENVQFTFEVPPAAKFSPGQVAYGHLVVSDPCYLDKSHIPALAGKWKVFIPLLDVGKFGLRAAGLLAWHADSYEKRPTPSKSGSPKFVVGVDSGQVVICPKEDFHPEKDDWYEAVCQAWRTDGIPCGKLPKGDGVVVESGMGDGGYQARGVTDGSKYKCLYVDFGIEALVAELAEVEGKGVATAKEAVGKEE